MAYNLQRLMMANKYWLRDNTNKDDKYPPYNTGVRMPNAVGGNLEYFIEVAIAGHDPDKITVKTKVISGVNFLYINTNMNSLGFDDFEFERETERVEYSHKGISSRSFSLAFELGKSTKITDVHTKDGILTVSMRVDLPTEEDVQEFEIKKGT